MDIDAAMQRAVGALNHMADTCQYLEQKAELWQISQELLNARVAFAELIKAENAVWEIYSPLIGNMRTGSARSVVWERLRDARARIGGANG